MIELGNFTLLFSFFLHDSYQASKLEKAEHKKEQKDLAAHFKELEEENKALRLSLQNLTEKVEKQESIAAAEINQQAEKQNSSSIKIQNNSEIIENLSSKIQEIQFDQKKFQENQQFEQKEQNDKLDHLEKSIQALSKKPKGLDRFKVHVQMPKQKPLDD